MKKILLLFIVASSVCAEQRDYSSITNRNAFDLAYNAPAKVIVPPLLEKPPIELKLTGIITRRGVTTVYMVSKDISKKYLTVSTKQRTDSGVTLLSVVEGLVKVNNNGTVETLSFATHRLPTIVTLPKLNTLPVVIKKKDDKSKSVKIVPQTPKANVVTVPSRRPKIDPRIIQKGLEYLDKVEDKEKREYILQRLERLQSGQEKIDRKIETNEKRRQYDERNRDRNK
tara:strand:+ start:620 stop:1300 length:681 start_codon:yes stop_codon:yes gene_type:complete